jgi:hypothetical protein
LDITSTIGLWGILRIRVVLAILTVQLDQLSEINLSAKRFLNLALIEVEAISR